MSGTNREIVVERTYRATPKEVWDLWATKDGFESWWGPEGFRVEVHVLDPRAGGALQYDMIADAPEAIAAMKDMDQPVVHGTHGKYGDFAPYERMTLVHVIDFIPGMDPYETIIEVELHPEGEMTRMVVTLHPHRDAYWTEMSAEGFRSQLTKLDTRFS